MTLGNLIREYRTKHNLSQRQFAIDCNLSNGYISFLEKGENPNTGKPIVPTIPQLQKLSSGLHMTLSELLESIDDMPVDISASFLSEPLSSSEISMLNYFRQLNQHGQQKVIAYIEDLMHAGIYSTPSNSD